MGQRPIVIKSQHALDVYLVAVIMGVAHVALFGGARLDWIESGVLKLEAFRVPQLKLLSAYLLGCVPELQVLLIYHLGRLVVLELVGVHLLLLLLLGLHSHLGVIHLEMVSLTHEILAKGCSYFLVGGINHRVFLEGVGQDAVGVEAALAGRILEAHKQLLLLLGGQHLGGRRNNIFGHCYALLIAGLLSEQPSTITPSHKVAGVVYLDGGGRNGLTLGRLLIEDLIPVLVGSAIDIFRPVGSGVVAGVIGALVGRASLAGGA